MSTATILFVDDEPSILSGIRRLLRRYSQDWSLMTVDCAADALKAMDETHVDVLVTDMRMPRAGGAWLLEQARQHHPTTARMVLSGDAGHDNVIAAAGPTHRYLSKPCDPEELTHALRQTLAASRLLDDEHLCALLGAQVNLPKPGRVWDELTTALEDPEADTPTIAAILRSDLAMTAEVLKLVNSAFFALPSQVTDVERATTLLGARTIRSLALAGGMFAPTTALPPGLDTDRLRDAAVAASLRARTLAAGQAWEPRAVDDVALAVLLHDVGLLVLAAHDHAAWARFDALGRPDDAATQTEVFGCPVPRASAFILGLWGFPPDTTAALANQPLDLDDPLQLSTATPAEVLVRTARNAATAVVGAGATG